jgi:hypothetical protein
MTPENATMTPVTMAATTKAVIRKRATGMPSVAAVSSLMVMALSDPATTRNHSAAPASTSAGQTEVFDA